MGEIIVITSGKGGVGKTTTTANLGAALSKNGKSVVLVDADIGLRNLDVVLGLENRVVYDLLDYIEGRCKLQQALVKDKRFDGRLYLLPAPQNKDKDAITEGQMKKLCEELKQSFDFVLIDCPAGIEQGFKNAIHSADKALVVVTPEISSVRDSDRVIGLLEANSVLNIKLIINRIRIDMVQRGEMMSIEDVTSILAVELIGMIPDDQAIIVSTNKGDAAVEYESSQAGKAYLNIAGRLLGQHIELIDFFKKPSWSMRILSFFKKGATS